MRVIKIVYTAIASNGGEYMDRKVAAFGAMAVILCIVILSGCTSGPAGNATPTMQKVTLSPSVTPIPTIAKMTNVSDVGVAGNNTTGLAADTAINNSTGMRPGAVNNTTAK
jgi:hypothetical protein